MRAAGLIGKGRPSWRKLDLNLGKRQQGGEEQDKSHHTDPAHLSTCHTASIRFWGKQISIYVEYTASLRLYPPAVQALLMPPNTFGGEVPHDCFFFHPRKKNVSASLPQGRRESLFAVSISPLLPIGHSHLSITTYYQHGLLHS